MLKPASGLRQTIKISTVFVYVFMFSVIFKFYKKTEVWLQVLCSIIHMLPNALKGQCQEILIFFEIFFKVCEKPSKFAVSVRVVIGVSV